LFLQNTIWNKFAIDTSLLNEKIAEISGAWCIVYYIIWFYLFTIIINDNFQLFIIIFMYILMCFFVRFFSRRSRFAFFLQRNKKWLWFCFSTHLAIICISLVIIILKKKMLKTEQKQMPGGQYNRVHLSCKWQLQNLYIFFFIILLSVIQRIMFVYFFFFCTTNCIISW
jgi:hypothetical protein